MKKIIIAVLGLSLVLLASGCSKEKSIDEDIYQVPQGVVEGDESGDALDPSMGMVLAGADEEKKIDLSTIKSIELFDLDGVKVEKNYSEAEMTAIGTSYNDSSIDDIAYIEMITGYTMVITLDNDQTIRMTSFGDENHVVATTKDLTYNLICPEIGKILLTPIE
ncbi:MAG: hypothetical protein H7X94_00250 [Vallitaleaceae bacterium]|nr:hypothetical protein [Vallitaleaceae bacterium]